MRLAVFTILTLGTLFAQDAVVQRKANLLPTPSASEAPDAVLQPGDRLTLLDPTPEHGYYQVKTTDGKDGWVSLRSIRVIASPSASEPAVDPETANANGLVKCDDTLWTHVYHPSRLIVKQPCIAVTGTIVDATNGSKS